MNAFCEECGAKIIENNNFCIRCGQPTAEASGQLHSIMPENLTKTDIGSDILNTLSGHARNISEKHTLKSMKSWSSWWILPILVTLIIFGILLLIKRGTGGVIIFIGAAILATVQHFEIKKAYREIINNKCAHHYLMSKEGML